MFSQPRAPPAPFVSGNGATNTTASHFESPNPNYHTVQASTGSSAYSSNGFNNQHSTSNSQSSSDILNDVPMQLYHQTFCRLLNLDVSQRTQPNEYSTKAREKLLNLPVRQFADLATDVYDELQRRTDTSIDKPIHLPSSDRFHHKRNHGRERLSILSPSKFNDLCTDILFGIEQRFPDVVEKNRLEYNAAQSATNNDYDDPNTNAQQSGPEGANFDRNGSEQEQQPTKPVAQPLQQTTIIPTKGTLVEESDDEDGDDANENTENRTQDEIENNHTDNSRNLDESDGAALNSENLEDHAKSIKDESENDEQRYTHIENGDDDDDEDVEGLAGETSVLSNTELSESLNRGSILDSIAEEESTSDTNSKQYQHSRIYSRSSSRFSKDFRLSKEISGQITPPESNKAGFFDAKSLDFDNKDVSEQLKDKDEQIEMLVDEGSRMDETINKLETQLAESEELKNSLVEENGRLHELVSQLEKEKEEPSVKLQQLEKDHGESKSRMENEINQYQDQIREIEKKLADAEAQNLTMQDKHADFLNKQNEFNEKSTKMNQTITDHQNKIAEYEAIIAAHGEAEKTRNVSNASENSEELQKKYDRLKKDHSKLNKELEQQQKITDQVRQEASAFLEEMRTLASNQSSWDSSRTLATEIQDLKLEVQEWKSRYLRAKSQVRNARASTYGGGNNRNMLQPSLNALEKESPYYDEDEGVIRDTSVHKFQISMEDFLIKSRTDAGNLLDHLHHLVVAARGITQDITDSGSNNNHNGALQSELAQCTSMVSTTANHLITTTRNHTTSGGLAPIAVLDAAASDLSSAVIELVKLAKIRPQTDGPEEVLPPRPESSGFDDDNGGYDYEHDYSAGSGVINDKENLHGLGVKTEEGSNYMTAHSSLKKKSPVDSSANSDNTKRQEKSASTTPTESKVSTPHGTMRNVSSSSSQKHSSSVKQDMMSPSDAHRDVEEERIRVKNAMVQRKRYASIQDPISPANFVVDDPDNTVAELQAYLEEKTLGVIDSIQNLLTGIRGNSTMGELRPYVKSITSSVDHMIEATGNSMKQTRNRLLKDKGEYIMANLEDSSQRMINQLTNAENLADSDTPDRNLKQRLAGLSFDLSKCTKELVKTVEEVSLKTEIQDIDDQLGDDLL